MADAAPPPSAPPSAPRPKPAAVAVALEYDWGTDNLPRIAASGRGAVAERILELAFANGVKVREDADLAQLLATVDIDCEIPVEAIFAVAEILSYLYRANGNRPPAKETP
ncbi:MAG TPA: EscU/YscU/HrcU family type III secretion system export apparatus switch protein [Alphaproteobacteria bacterium]|nr:EscU/YscU/HrcU family type III secretion system export apparatus switch protein [Alphaproteobacteria bacterium]